MDINSGKKVQFVNSLVICPLFPPFRSGETAIIAGNVESLSFTPDKFFHRRRLPAAGCRLLVTGNTMKNMTIYFCQAYSRI